jgi:uncharacterized membrane protein
MKLVNSIAAASAVILFVALPGPRAVQEQEKSAEKPKAYTYVKDVAPIVKTYCLNCHGTDSENPSELSMDDFGSLMKGGKHGVSLVPGKPNESNLYLKLLQDPPFGKQMPRGRKKMTPEAFQVIHDWIEQGAKEK